MQDFIMDIVVSILKYFDHNKILDGFNPSALYDGEKPHWRFGIWLPTSIIAIIWISYYYFPAILVKGMPIAIGLTILCVIWIIVHSWIRHRYVKDAKKYGDYYDDNPQI